MSNTRSFNRRHAFLLGLAPVVACAFVYARILEHFFWKDDFYHLYDLNNVGAVVDLGLSPSDCKVFTLDLYTVFYCGDIILQALRDL